MTQNGTKQPSASMAISAPAAMRDSTHAFEPSSIDEAARLAKILVASRLLPRSVQTPEAAFTIIATGRELGLTAMQSLRSIHVIEGKPTLSADLGAALVKKHPACKYFMLVESTEKIATFETQRVGEPRATKMSFTIEEAQRAGVTGKDNWKKYPAAMLRARCIMALARAVYPDALLAVYDPDELEPTPQQMPTRRVEFDAETAPAQAPRAPLPETVGENHDDVAEAFSLQIDMTNDLNVVREIRRQVEESNLTPAHRTTLLDMCALKLGDG